ncbi:MAG: hypothetical protein V4447_14760 [Pseudomonadota bacterium]
MPLQIKLSGSIRLLIVWFMVTTMPLGFFIYSAYETEKISNNVNSIAFIRENSVLREYNELKSKLCSFDEIFSECPALKGTELQKKWEKELEFLERSKWFTQNIRKSEVNGFFAFWLLVFFGVTFLWSAMTFVKKGFSEKNKQA